MANTKISDDIKYIGVNDEDIDLFENQYIVPNGISYNSYVLLDEKVAVMDTVDDRKTDAWLENLEKTLNGRKVDYIITHHIEPDHSGSLKVFLEKYPDAIVVGNAKSFQFIAQFFNINIDNRKLLVKDGDTLSLGKHTLKFIIAPMVHWPEVMFSYEITEKILFSADAFGKFGIIGTNEEWLSEARRYYINIVGKYGVQVQAILKKLSSINIDIICPLHGEILNENISYYINKYDIWSSYKPENNGIVIAYASIHGNTALCAEKIADALKLKCSDKIVLFDLSRSDVSEVVSNCFCYDKVILACSTYDGGLFPPMENLLNHLKNKNFQNRKVALVENGTWAPMTAKLMKSNLETMKNINICENVVTLKSAMNDKTDIQIDNMINELLSNL